MAIPLPLTYMPPVTLDEPSGGGEVISISPLAPITPVLSNKLFQAEAILQIPPGHLKYYHAPLLQYLPMGSPHLLFQILQGHIHQ